MTEILKRITTTFAARKRKTAGDYRGLVTATADGQDLDLSKAAEILDSCDKTPADLAADVALLVRRRDLRAKIDALPELATEEAKLAEKIATADKALATAEAKHTDAVWPLENRLAEIAAAKAAAAQAKGELQQTCPRGELTEELGTLSAELTAIGKKTSPLAEDERSARVIADSKPEEWSGGDSALRMGERGKWIQQKREEADRLAGELAKLRQRTAEIIARQAEIAELQLQP